MNEHNPQVSAFLRQFDYNHWANREACDAILLVQPAPDAAARVMAHVVGAEWLWLSRLKTRPSPLPVWPDLAPAAALEQLRELRGAWARWFERLDDRALTRPVDYVNSKGEAYASSVGDILMHLLLHSAYHRGQVAMELRRAGAEPAYTDFIHATRRGRLG